MPIKPARMCPPNKARGCAAGNFVKPNKKSVDPPKEASKTGFGVNLINASEAAMAKLEPKQTQLN